MRRMTPDTRLFALVSLSVPLALYAVFFIYPALRGFYISLFHWSGFGSSMKFVGLGNFKELFADTHFWVVVMRNTFALIFVGGILVFAISLLFSHLLTERIPGKRFLRAVIFFPMLINEVALAVLWSFIYNSHWGLLNGVLDALGLGGLVIDWTAPNHLFWSLTVAIVWMWVGFFTVILMAALDRIPTDFLDAARVEGATPGQIFRRIKLPLIRDVLSISVVLWVISAMKEFSLLWSWGGGGSFPKDGQTNLAVYMFAMAFGSRSSIYRMGLASAMGVIMLVLVALLVALFWRLMGRNRLEY